MGKKERDFQLEGESKVQILTLRKGWCPFLLLPLYKLGFTRDAQGQKKKLGGKSLSRLLPVPLSLPFSLLCTHLPFSPSYVLTNPSLSLLMPGLNPFHHHFQSLSGLLSANLRGGRRNFTLDAFSRGPTCTKLNRPTGRSARAA